MLLDLSKTFEAKKAEVKLKSLIDKGAKIELTEKTGSRSTSQNSYLHAVLTIFAVEYGERLEYVKQHIFKSVVNTEIFLTEYVNVKTGEVREDLKSSKDISKHEMNTSIERFRNFASENGIYIMDADEFKNNYFLVKQMEEQNKEFL